MSTAVLQEWSGGKLTNASFLGYATSSLKIMAKTGFDSLALQTIGPQLQQAINTFAGFINKSSAFDETAAIAKLDAKRDALFNALYYAWHYCAQIDEDDDFGKHAFSIRNIMNSYKGTYAHELTKESMEIQGLQRDLETTVGVSALKELGLYKIAGQLFETNTLLMAEIAKRESERGGRVVGRSEETAVSVRKTIVSLLAEAFRKINAVNSLQSTDATAKAATDITGIVAHYKLVAKKPAAKQDEPDPSPDPSGDDDTPDTPPEA